MKNLKGLKKQQGFLSAVVSGLFSSKAASRSRVFQSGQTAQQMAFQERMSNTAHQREVRDLRTAGLNPILSGTGGMGSSSPGGASASGAMAALPNFSALALVKAQVEKIKAETDLTTAKTGSIQPFTKGGRVIGGGIDKMVHSARGAANLWKNRKWLYNPPPSGINFGNRGHGPIKSIHFGSEKR